MANRMKKEGKEPKYTITLDHLKHVEEFVELMNAITNSDRFSMIPKIVKERGEGRNRRAEICGGDAEGDVGRICDGSGGACRGV